MKNAREWLRWKLYAIPRAYIVRLRVALRAVPQVVLGNHVVWKGRVWLVVNGVVPSRWDLATFPEGDRRESAPREEVRRVRNLREYWHSFWARWDWWGYHHATTVGRFMGPRYAINGRPYAYYGTSGAIKRRSRKLDRRIARRLRREGDEA